MSTGLLLHYFFFWQPQGFSWGKHRMIWAYLFNFVVTGTMFAFLHFAPARYRENLGFVFMGGTSLGFMGFFIFFYPFYRGDGDMSTTEFAAFFVPYSIALAFKTLYFIAALRRAN